jgi:hypothetical protein
MKRDYDAGEFDNVTYFTGTEVEHTPAYGMYTLFVTGVQPVKDIEEQLLAYNQVEHIFFGANHSVQANKVGPGWGEMITHFLKQDYWCSLDIPITCAEEILEDGLTEYDNFIPQIRVPIPYVKLWNYNTMIKIDDKGFAATNPGVWSHRLHDLMDANKFTNWSKYGLDKPIK